MVKKVPLATRKCVCIGISSKKICYCDSRERRVGLVLAEKHLLLSEFGQYLPPEDE